MKDAKRKKLKGTEIFVIVFIFFLLIVGLMEKRFSFDDSLLFILGFVFGVIVLKKWIIQFLYDQIVNYEKHDDDISSSINQK